MLRQVPRESFVAKFIRARSLIPLAAGFVLGGMMFLHPSPVLIPVRKTRLGEDVDLKSILQAEDSSLLSEVGKAIDAKDPDRFTVA